MVFGFWSRKSTAPAPAAPVQVAGSTSAQESSSSAGTTPGLGGDFKFPKDGLHTPAPSISISQQLNAVVATPPPATPSPPPDLEPEPPKKELVTDPRALYTLITSVPPQTLHTYCLKHLNPANFPSSSPSPKSRRKGKGRVSGLGDETREPAHRRSQSIGGGGQGEENDDDAITPETLTQLTQFFKSLVPPPQLHCVRCHKFYFELDNTDTSCRVPHDDDSTIVERVGVAVPTASSSKGKARSGEAATYETLWGCCGKVVEGDGDQGPPDGWCYEGRHTVDTKRARFRADSTLHDDKLQSCGKLRCFVNTYSRPPVSQSTNASGSTNAGRKNTRKRTMSKAVLEDQEMSEKDDDRKSTASGTGSVAKRRRKSRKVVSPAEVQDDDDGGDDQNQEDDPEETGKDDKMDVDQEESSAPAPPRSPPASPRRVPRPTARSLASAAQARTRSSSRKPRSKLGTSGDGNSLPPVPIPSSNSFPTTDDSRGRTATATTANTRAYVEISTLGRSSRSKSRSPVRPAAVMGSVSVKELKKTFSVASLKAQERAQDSDNDTVASDSKVVRAGRKGTRRRATGKKGLEEVVDSSVVGEV